MTKHVPKQGESTVQSIDSIDKHRTNKQGTGPKPPSFPDFEAYFLEHGFTSELAARAFKGYAEANPPWTDTKGNKIRSWKQKCQNVWFRDENKPQATPLRKEVQVEYGTTYTR